MAVINQPSASPFGGLALVGQAGAVQQRGVPSSICCPDNKRPVSVAPLTVAGCCLLTAAFTRRKALNCQAEAVTRRLYWTYRSEQSGMMRAFSFPLLYRTPRGVSRIFKRWEEEKAVHISLHLEMDSSQRRLLQRP